MVLKIPAWAQWIRDEKGYPRCCYLCIDFVDGKCQKFERTPPPDFAATPGVCDSFTRFFDDIPF